MKTIRFPPAWNETRVRRVLAHYEKQTEEEAAREDEGALKNKARTTVQVPRELLPLIRELICQYSSRGK